MSNAVSKFVAVILALLLLYIYPTLEAARRQDDLSQMIVTNAVTQFVDAVRSKGYVTPTMYNEFIRDVYATGNEYVIHMEHLHKKYHPEYTDAADPNTFQDTFNVVYEGFYDSDLTDVLFPDNSLPLDSESRKYKMMVGDFFKVSISNTNRTPANVMSDLLYGSGYLSGERAAIAFPYGGMVLNEDY